MIGFISMAPLAPATLGIAFAFAAYGTYAVADAMVKALGTDLGVFEIGLMTTLFSFLPAALAKPRHERWRETFRFSRPVLVHVLGITRMLSSVLITYSFVTIPLAEAYCLVFLVPVLTTILSIIFLREPVSLDRWVLVIVSFLGVLLVVRPGFRELELGHLTAFGCALSAAVSVVVTRLISSQERRITLFVIPGLYTLGANATLLLVLGFTLPHWTLLGMLVLCGILGGAGYLLQIAALARTPASRVAPIQYSQIVWALLFGALFFGEFPDALALAGIGIVVASGLANIFADGARARIAGRWAQYRGRRALGGPTGFKGPGPDPV